MEKVVANVGEPQYEPMKFYRYMKNQEKPDKSLMTKQRKHKGL